jgi:hypothetical protein
MLLRKPGTSPLATSPGDERGRLLAQLGFICWCLLLVSLAYGSSVELPFFFDDFVHLPFVDAHTFAEIWQTAGSSYYRPVNFALWRLAYTGLDYHSTTLYHALNLGLHLANGMMVGWLANRLWSRNAVGDPGQITSDPIHWWRGYLSAALFILYPFSYQAVPWVGSLSHLLVTFFILLTLISYLQMRRSRGYIFGGISLFAALLALFTHENGVLIGPFIAAIEFTEPDRKTTPMRTVRTVVLWMLPTLLWLPVWSTVPKATGGSLTNLESMGQNTAYFAQGIAYPFTRLGGWLRDSYNLNDMVTAAGLSLLAFVLIGLVQRFSHASRRALLPWFWCGIAALPAILFLQFSYVVDGPRLLMVASVGTSWLWTDAILRLFRWRKLYLHGRRYGAGLATLLTFVILIPSQEFIRTRMNMHQVLGSAFSQAIEKATLANRAGYSAIFVNLPSWLAPRHAAFALGHEGVAFWPTYAPPESLVAVQEGVPGNVSFVRVDAILPELPYIAGVTGGSFDWSRFRETPGRVFVPRYRTGSVSLESAGVLSFSPPAGSRQLASFTFDAVSPSNTGDHPAHAVTLLGAQATVTSPASTEIRLVWSIQEVSSENITVFVHLVDHEGRLVGQADGDPVAGSLPFSQWPSHSVVEDVRWVEIGDPNLTLYVGLYRRPTGERLLATSPPGTPWPQNAVPIDLENGE